MESRAPRPTPANTPSVPDFSCQFLPIRFAGSRRLQDMLATLDIVNRTANLVSRLRVPARGARGEIAKETTNARRKRTIRRPVRFFLPGTPQPENCKAAL